MRSRPLTQLLSEVSRALDPLAIQIADLSLSEAGPFEQPTRRVEVAALAETIDGR